MDNINSPKCRSQKLLRVWTFWIIISSATSTIYSHFLNKWKTCAVTLVTACRYLIWLHIWQGNCPNELYVKMLRSMGNKACIILNKTRFFNIKIIKIQLRHFWNYCHVYTFYGLLKILQLLLPLSAKYFPKWLLVII